MLFSDHNAELQNILPNANFGMFLENYQKIVLTPINHSKHHVKAIDFKTGEMLTENSENKIKTRKSYFHWKDII